jgi:excisionase family DNA binding protein
MEQMTMMDFAPTAQFNRRKTDHQPMPDINEFMTTDEAAKALDYTVESVRQMVFKKKIESIRLGRSILIPKKAVKEYLEKTKGMSKHDPRRRTK